ncbi:MAG: hypothetical protein ACTHN3_09725 [Solirubrobacterales bacterium]
MSESPDIDELIKGFERRADEAKDRAREIQATEVPPAGDPDALIQGVAENLSKMLEAAGLPSQEPAEVEAQIRRRQRSLSSKR